VPPSSLSDGFTVALPLARPATAPSPSPEILQPFGGSRH